VCQSWVEGHRKLDLRSAEHRQHDHAVAVLGRSDAIDTVIHARSLTVIEGSLALASAVPDLVQKAPPILSAARPNHRSAVNAAF